MNIIAELQEQVSLIIRKLFNEDISPPEITIQPTKKEFEGEYTVVLFPLVRILRKNPQQLGEAIASVLMLENPNIVGFRIVSGFLNLSLSDAFWRGSLQAKLADPQSWMKRPTGRKVMIESASPNTNKPIHLGHIRNILLGASVAKIKSVLGNEVVKVQIINDRGIAICKSMLAWSKWGNDETPESSGVKGDHFVGGWYVRFEKEFQAEYLEWQNSEEARNAYAGRGDKEQSEEAFFKEYKNRYFNNFSRLGREAREMLLKWEEDDPETVALWKTMNGWVYQGFDATYASLGVTFDKLYYESDTYLLGKKYIREGLEAGIFYRKEDGSVWVDLQSEGLDEKVLLRADGTSVYITQDIGTAQIRNEEFTPDEMIYVVADEQNYHFEVLFATLRKLGVPYADGLYHLAYGMVDLPTGKMKSREGTVVDADVLIEDVKHEAALSSVESGEIAGLSEEVQKDIIDKIALGALKYYILKVDPRKRMTFNPAESVDLQGQTGPYIQNAFVRIQSILRKAEQRESDPAEEYQLLTIEKQLLGTLDGFGFVLQAAGDQFSPALIANYLYDLAKDFHRYYHEVRVLNAETRSARDFRLSLIEAIARTIEDGMSLLGIEMPERM